MVRWGGMWNEEMWTGCAWGDWEIGRGRGRGRGEEREEKKEPKLTVTDEGASFLFVLIRFQIISKQCPKGNSSLESQGQS